MSRGRIKGQHPWLRRGILVLLGLLIGLSVYLINGQNLLGEQLPMPFGYGVTNVLSGSMEPTFSKGALLLVRQSQQVQVGDIVVYQSGRVLVVHRIVALDGDTVTAQGDANNGPDEPFDKENIRGVVVGWLPHGGEMVDFLKSPGGMILIFLCAFWLVEGSFRKQKEDDEKKLEQIKAEIEKLREENP